MVFKRKEKVGYEALHIRVGKIKGKPKKCENCGTTDAKKFEWANQTGNYYDIKDYKRLCTSCHAKSDKRVLNTKGHHKPKLLVEERKKRHNEHSKRYYLNNKEKVKEREKKYNQKNRIVRKMKQKMWREKNRELLRQKQNKYYLKNKNKINAKRRKK